MGTCGAGTAGITGGGAVKIAAGGAAGVIWAGFAMSGIIFLRPFPDRKNNQLAPKVTSTTSVTARTIFQPDIPEP